MLRYDYRLLKFSFFNLLLSSLGDKVLSSGI